MNSVLMVLTAMSVSVLWDRQEADVMLILMNVLVSHVSIMVLAIMEKVLIINRRVDSRNGLNDDVIFSPIIKINI